MSVELLIDNSAWARLDNRLAATRRAEIASWLDAGRIATCLPFLLEAGYSARSATDHEALLDELFTLPRLHIDERIEQRATDAQRQLARVGHHRLAPVDLIVAATADAHRIGVLHYDADFDVLAKKTDLRFDSVWLAPRGTI